MASMIPSVMSSGRMGIPPSILAAFGGLEAQFDEDGGLSRFSRTWLYENVEYMRDLYAKGALPKILDDRPTDA